MLKLRVVYVSFAWGIRKAYWIQSPRTKRWLKTYDMEGSLIPPMREIYRGLGANIFEYEVEIYLLDLKDLYKNTPRITSAYDNIDRNLIDIFLGNS